MLARGVNCCTRISPSSSPKDEPRRICSAGCTARRDKVDPRLLAVDAFALEVGPFFITAFASGGAAEAADERNVLVKLELVMSGLDSTAGLVFERLEHWLAEVMAGVDTMDESPSLSSSTSSWSPSRSAVGVEERAGAFPFGVLMPPPLADPMLINVQKFNVESQLLTNSKSPCIRTQTLTHMIAASILFDNVRTELKAFNIHTSMSNIRSSSDSWRNDPKRNSIWPN